MCGLSCVTITKGLSELYKAPLPPVEPDDVPDFVDQEGIGGEFEDLGPMGLEPKRPPDAPDGHVAESGLLSHLAGAAVTRPLGVWSRGCQVSHADDFAG